MLGKGKKINEPYKKSARKNCESKQYNYTLQKHRLSKKSVIFITFFGDRWRKVKKIFHIFAL